MKRKILLIIIYIMCFGTATYSLINIVKWNKDNNKSKQIISDIQTNNFNDSD